MKTSKRETSIREKFEKDFDIQFARTLEACAYHHENGLHPNHGSDPFKWVLMLCISYQCFEKKDYREYHHVPKKYSYRKIKNWIIKNADLGSYDGDIDFVAVFAGAYNEYLPKSK